MLLLAHYARSAAIIIISSSSSGMHERVLTYQNVQRL